MKNKKEVVGINIIILMIILLIPLSLAITISDSIESSISITGGVRCSEDRTEFIDYSDLGRSLPTYNPVDDSASNCFYEGAIAEIGYLGDPEMCCPSGFACEVDSSSPGGLISKCVASGINYCSGYSNEDDCNLDTSTVGVTSVELTEVIGFCGVQPIGVDSCWDTNNCGCEWDIGDSSCGAIKLVINTCVSSSGTITSTTNNGKCVRTQTLWDDQCATTGIIKAAWDADGTLDFAAGGPRESECQPVSRDIVCPDITKLSFFSWFNLVVIILILFIGYYYYIKNLKRILKKSAFKIL